MVYLDCVVCHTKVPYKSQWSIDHLKTKMCRKCFMMNYPKREKAWRWKGGKIITTKGYIRVLNREHPYANRMGYVLEHRLIMEEYLGRYLERNEVVHHKNRDKKDNRIENLEVLTPSDHSKRHNKERRIETCKICDKKHSAKGYCDWHYRKYYLKPLHTKNSH